MIEFSIRHTDGEARRGQLVTPHGTVQTPTFMPVATRATVKALSPAEVATTGAEMVIMNTYHLWLRPGEGVVAEQGGLHDFSRWRGSIATDSGGFQAFSLAERVKVTEEGFRFSSHLDGRPLFLSPEEAMRIQGALGSDIALQLDICPPASSPPDVVRAAVERTTRWARRCLDARVADQALFGIVQGGVDIDLRRQHARELGELPLDGIALGGFSVGEAPAEMHRALRGCVSAVDPLRPRYLMGVGTPLDLIVAVGCGVDVFDCVMPTRNARNGEAFLRTGKLKIRNARWERDPRPIEEGCPCEACAGGFSRSVLRHLFQAGEILAHRLISLHNLTHYGTLMREAREAIVAGAYGEWAAERIARMTETRGESVG